MIQILSTMKFLPSTMKFFFLFFIICVLTSSRRLSHRIPQEQSGFPGEKVAKQPPPGDALFVGGNQARHKEMDGLASIAAQFNFQADYVCDRNEANDLTNKQFKLGEDIIVLNTSATQKRFRDHLKGIGISDDKADRALGFMLSNSDDESWSELAQWLVYLAEVESGQRTISRMVISMHGHVFGFFGEIMGGYSLTDITSLYMIFPTAAGQLKHLMLSACQSGMKTVLENYKSIFPNLESVMGYTGSSPSVSSGSVIHIKLWAEQTRPGQPALTRDAMVRAIRANRRARWSHPNNVAIWTPSGGYQCNPRAVQEEGDRYSTWKNLEEQKWLAYVNGLKDPEAGSSRAELLRIYTLINHISAALQVTGSELETKIRDEFIDWDCPQADHPEDEEYCDKEENWTSDPNTEDANRRVNELKDLPRKVLAMRFYHAVKKNLASTYPDALTAYSIISMNTNFVSLRRSQLQSNIDSVDTKLAEIVDDTSGGRENDIDKVSALLELLRHGLRDMTEAYIPLNSLERWISTDH